MNTTVEASIASSLQTIAGLRVLFAHQSVGGDILDGVETLAKSSGTQLSLQQQRALDHTSAGIAHFLVGENGDPERKIADYVAAVDSSPVPPDVAVLKLCYIDFDTSTDPERLADHYIQQLDALQARHPHTRVIAVTAPLTIVQTGPKAILKRLLGRPLGGYELNARRHVFNERVREHFPIERLFDLARAEAHGVDVASLSFDGRPLEAMNPSFTSDGGHLNSTGQEHVARAFVNFLATQAAPR